MSFLEIVKEIKTKIEEKKNIDFYIINNTLGRNIILLLGNKELCEETKRELETNYKNYIEDIYISSAKKNEEKNEYIFEEYFYNKIKEIGKLNDIIHRNSSYKNWLRKKEKFENNTTQIITGYSFKGGMGRSSTISYLAYLFYLLGKKVVVLDCDFEAPGIASMLFEKEKRERSLGIIDFLIDNNIESIEDISKYFLEMEVSQAGGNLYMFPSGIDYQSYEYLNKLSKLDFNSEFYNDLFLILLKKINEKVKPDVIFIDLRAGINESSGFILNEIADKNILFFNSEEQNRDGMKIILNRIDSSKTILMNSTIRFTLSEIVELKIKEFEKIIKDNFPEYLDKILLLPYEASVLDSIEVFKKFVFNQSTIVNNEQVYLKNLIKKLNLHSEESVEPENEIVEKDRKEILIKLKQEFDKVTGGNKFTTQEDLKYFYFKEDLLKIINEQIILILGAKGSGKSSLFEIFTKNYDEILKKLNVKNNKYIDGFSKSILNNFTVENSNNIAKISKGDIIVYERFWKYLTIYKIEEYLNKKERTFKDFNSIYTKLSDLNFSLEIETKLKDLNREFYDKDEYYTLVYDELDVSFGDKKDEFISSLISFWRNNLYKYGNIRSKIFLRKDIFNSLEKLDNKTHLSINSYHLNWNKKEILSLILKIIVCTLTEEELKILGIDDIVSKKIGTKVELVNNEENIVEAIHKIFGKKFNEARKNISNIDEEIIKNLSDANNDITPRTIYKFMSSTIEQQLCFEKNDLENNSSILFKDMNKYYIKVLKECSDFRILEYKEEYPNCKAYIDKIKKIGFRKFTLDDYIQQTNGRKNKGTLENELKTLVESGFITIDGNDYTVSNLYYLALELKKNRRKADKIKK